MGVPSDSVEVAIQSGLAFVRVHGRGTFKIAPGLKQFGMAAMEKGCNRLLVEMGDCLGMDSTFMGVMAGLAVCLKKKDGELVLFHVSEKNVLLVKVLGLGHLVRVEQGEVSDPIMPTGTRVLEVGEDKDAITKTMITAHEMLVKVSPDNIVKFKDVLAFLKEDLKRAAGQNGVEQSVLNDHPVL
jgi:anti-sigma B factor antagonist